MNRKAFSRLVRHGKRLVVAFYILAQAANEPAKASSSDGRAAAASPGLALKFSANPTTQEIFHARVFAEPLVPIGGEPTVTENADLAAALLGYAQRSGPDDFSSLTDFLQKHPRSPWRAALLTDLGLEYYNTAHYSLSLDAWTRAWALAKGATDTKGKAIGDRTVGELAYMYARLGRMNELDELLKSVEGRVFVGPATEKISGARDGLWTMQNRPEVAFRCGPLALHRIKAITAPTAAADMEIFNSASTQRGMSLPQVAEISRKIGLNYQMAFREKEGAFVVPSVIHWKVGHYAAMTRRDGNRFLLQDPTFGNDVWATTNALESEASGYFLIPSGSLPKGWRAVSAKEGEKVWGKGVTVANDQRNIFADALRTINACWPEDLSVFDDLVKNMQDQQNREITQLVSRILGEYSAMANKLVQNIRMAVPSVHLMVVNLNLTDSPVGYAPPVGPEVEFTVRYNHREAFQPGIFTYSNFGPKWTCDWISYITDNPQSLLADVNHYVQGGGTRTYTGFNTNTLTFAFQQYHQTRLTRIATNPISYEMLSGNGSKMIFSQSDGSVGTSRKIFLTQIIDPFTNAVTLYYDSSLRLTNITDAIGQVTTLSYTNATDTNKITRVTDPFGRFASFTYDSLGRLTNITDVIGLTSRFTYEGSGDFINALITPYGTTSFTRGGSGTTRWLETLYPDGSRDRVEFNQSTGLGIPDSLPVSQVPQGMGTGNAYLYARNTYYWSRSACATGYGDYTKAKIYHWLHTTDLTTCSGILESTKEALEGRVWYDYDGQSASIIDGSTDRPKHVGRVLDDGSTQLYTYGYNAFGNVTNTVDPLGRTFSYVYDTNGIDLLEVRMTRAGQNQLLSQATYNAQHLPLTTAGADGQTTTNTYNARGQLLTTSNPKGETTTYNYDTNGYLIGRDGALSVTNDSASFTYDSYGRTRTKTDVSGYAITLNYDLLDRITNITYPDGTFAQIAYQRFEPAVVQDRAGRQTSMEYNAAGLITKRTDPLGRVTQFQWCDCGSIKTLTDPMGRTSEWETDVQGRLIAKQYGDGSKISYFYENASGRLRQIVDEKSQATQFTYNRDNTVRSISYANAALPTAPVNFTYDPDYLRLLSTTDGTGTTTNQYVPITVPSALGAGQLASIDGPLANDTITYMYDELGRRAATAINGVAQRMAFDADGRVIGETNALGSFSYGHDGNSGRRALETFPNGLTTSRNFGNALNDNSLEKITHQAGATPISEFIYGRDLPAGRIRTWSQQFAAQYPRVYTFGYDAANQLLSASVTNSGVLTEAFAYAYDLAANRLIEQTSSATNAATYNALNQISVVSSSTTTSHTNEWDAAGRLVAVNFSNRRVEFAYGGRHQLASLRHLINDSEVSRRYFVWCDNELCEERDAGGAVIKRFFPQGVKVESGTNSGSYFYTRDHLDSIREIVDSSGIVRAHYAYDPFGRRTKLSGDMDADFGFAGMFWSAESGLSLTLFRAYDPELGRWLSRDPLSNAEIQEGPNLYAYVGNNPVNLVDLLGLCCEGLREVNSRKWEERNAECNRLKAIADQECQTESSARYEGFGPNPYGPGMCETARQAKLDYCTRAKLEIDKEYATYLRCLGSPCKPTGCSYSPLLRITLGP